MDLKVIERRNVIQEIHINILARMKIMDMWDHLAKHV